LRQTSRMPRTAAGWDRQAAARYLEAARYGGKSWIGRRKDHKTPVRLLPHPGALRGWRVPALRHELSEQGPSPSEQVMLASVEKRVRDGIKMQPFYSDVLSGAGRKSNRATPSRCLIP